MFRHFFVILYICVSLFGCNDEYDKTTNILDIDGSILDAFTPITLELVPGLSIGPISLGMDMAELKNVLGEPDRAIGFRRTMNLRYVDLSLEVVVSTVKDLDLSDTSEVIAVSTLPTASLDGPIVIGTPLEELTESYGEPDVVIDKVVYLTEQGLGLELDDDDRVQRVSVWAPFTLASEPPPMLEASGMPIELGEPSDTELPMFEFDGDRYEVIDAHLHTGFIESQLPNGMAFLVSQIPPFTQIYFPATTPQVMDAYNQYQGIKEHTRSAGVAHAVILATYTHHTIGYASNREIEAKLIDARNQSSDGLPWAWGMASVNYDDFEDEVIARQRLKALESYFEQYPDLFIGIKLAHAHQAVSFEDPIYLGVYDVAARQGVPVLLHTGLSPFPNTRTEPEFYDPGTLESIIEAYDGQHGQGRVDFILSHIGQGDFNAIEHSLQLAQKYDHVWLELSAINRALLLGAEGEPVDDPTLMHTYILEQIKVRGLTDRLIFATDGPQYFGKIHSYLKLMAESMRDAGFSKEELRGVFSQNFYRCFFDQE